MAVRGITRRWLFSSLGKIFAVLLAIECGLALFIHEHFYNEARQELNSQTAQLANIFPGYKENSEADFIERAERYVARFEAKNDEQVVVFDSEDKPIFSSSGELNDSAEELADYVAAKDVESRIGNFVGRDSRGEKIMAQTMAIYSDEGEFIGAIRYIVSLQPVDNNIFGLTLGSIIVGLAILLFVILSSSYFINSIVRPLREIGNTARKVALGDFNARLEKRFDDEVGDLCDTINYMARRLGESERMKNEFISSISHELRTPLTAIKGWAETLEMGEGRDLETNRRGLKVISREAERLCGLVEELLDFSRIQCGKMILSLERIDILAEISEAVYMFKDRAAAEEKDLIYAEPPILSAVLGDKNRLRQVFINIIDNALKYTPNGGAVTVNIKEAAGFIYISVSDTGCGIPAEHLPRVTDKFYKANTSQGGSGIGLAVVNEIVQLHSGTLDIASEENVGTVVMVAIPTDNASSET